MQWILDNLFTIISSVFGGTSLVAFFFERNKRRLEEKQLGADALSKMQEAYRTYTEDSNIRYKELKTQFEEEISELRDKLDTLIRELAEERIHSTKVTSENAILKKENEILHKELNECKDNI